MRKRSLIERIRMFGEAGINVVAAQGRATLFLFHALFGPSGLSNRFALLVRQLYSVGVLSLAIVVVSGVFIGMVLALQGYSILSSYGSEQAVGQMVALTLLRELGPVVTALLFAGRAGSALAAEIGNMKSTEQLSSLEMIGVDPLKYIIAPRLWAGFISLPLLTVIFNVVGIWGGAMVAVDAEGRELCRNFAAGKCKRAGKCPYSHAAAAQEAAPAAAEQAARRVRGARVVVPLPAAAERPASPR